MPITRPSEDIPFARAIIKLPGILCLWCHRERGGAPLSQSLPFMAVVFFSTGVGAFHTEIGEDRAGIFSSYLRETLCSHSKGGFWLENDDLLCHEAEITEWLSDPHRRVSAF